jgi:hypothetical protein
MPVILQRSVTDLEEVIGTEVCYLLIAMPTKILELFHARGGSR